MSRCECMSLFACVLVSVWESVIFGSMYGAMNACIHVCVDESYVNMCGCQCVNLTTRVTLRLVGVVRSVYVCVNVNVPVWEHVFTGGVFLLCEDPLGLPLRDFSWGFLQELIFEVPLG